MSVHLSADPAVAGAIHYLKYTARNSLALARPHLIVSMPREPRWRVLNVARGRYWANVGNTSGQLQHWSACSFLPEHNVEVTEERTPVVLCDR
jgi:hypothetical protein